MHLITGARGRVAQAVQAVLRDHGHPARLASRSPGEITVLSGVEVVAAPPEWGAALAGVASMFVYANPEGLQEALSAARSSSTTPHVVLLSAIGADAEARDPITRMHRAAEAHVRGSGLPWTIVRAGGFAANTLQWASEVRSAGSVSAPYPDAHAALVHERDLADVVALALTESEHAGEVYEITGPATITQAEQAAVISDAIGRDVTFRPISEATYRKELAQWGNEEMIDTLLGHLREADGQPASVSTTYRDLTGRPGRSYAQWATDHAEEFRGN
jgi:uncharacterized protein YbjT (DUF2867 family)